MKELKKVFSESIREFSPIFIGMLFVEEFGFWKALALIFLIFTLLFGSKLLQVFQKRKR